ncbi:hypothetical protein [Olleya sp. R77988]|uniref:hypothetical protein n=1 Tax=Olleya sp. R77988 TaxID=3093875 RepID=UPI0037C69D5E
MQFVIVYLISKEGGLKEIGIYGLVSSIVVPITTFFLFDVNSSILADDDIENNTSLYIGNAIINSVLAIPIVLILGYLFQLNLIIVLGFFFFKTALNFKQIFYSYYQRKECFDFLSGNQIIVFLLVSLSFVLYLKGYYDLKIFYISGTLVTLTLLIDFYLLKKKLNQHSSFIRIDFNFFKLKFKSGFNLGLNALVSSLKLNAPRYFAKFILKNIELVGVITVYTQIITGLSVLNLIYSRLNLGKVGNLLSSKVNGYKSKTYKIIIGNYLLITFFGAILILFDKQIIGYFFGEEYLDQIFVFRLLLVLKAITFPLVILKIIAINKQNEFYLTKATLITSLSLIGSIFFINQLTLFMIFYLIIEILMMVFIFRKTHYSLNSN